MPIHRNNLRRTSSQCASLRPRSETYRHRAGSWTSPDEWVANVEWHPGDFARAPLIVTKLASRRSASWPSTTPRHLRALDQATQGRDQRSRLSVRSLAAMRSPPAPCAWPTLGDFMLTWRCPRTAEPWYADQPAEKLIKSCAKGVTHAATSRSRMSESLQYPGRVAKKFGRSSPAAGAATPADRKWDRSQTRAQGSPYQAEQTDPAPQGGRSPFSYRLLCTRCAIFLCQGAQARSWPQHPRGIRECQFQLVRDPHALFP